MHSGDNINWRWVCIGGIVFLVLAGLAGQSDYEDAVREQAAYCSNVQQYKATGGQQGWPDYNDNYNELCETSSDS